MKIRELETLATPRSDDYFILNTTRGFRKITRKDLFSKFLRYVPRTAASHNCYYRGEDLLEKYGSIDNICRMISDGTFDDIFIGDYFDITITTTDGGEETVRCLIAGLDLYLNMGRKKLTKHHAVIIPEKCLKTAYPMNAGDASTGGYYNSDMHQKVLPIFYEAFNKALNSHIIPHENLLSTAITTSVTNMNMYTDKRGSSSAADWKTVNLQLLSDINVVGSNILCSSYLDAGIPMCFNIFNFRPELVRTGQPYWLSNVTCDEAFSAIMADGSLSGQSASSKLYVRPYFLIG